MSRQALLTGSIAVLAFALQSNAGLTKTPRVSLHNPKIRVEVAHDLSAPLRSIAGRKSVSYYKPDASGVVEIGKEDIPVAPNVPSLPDGARQKTLPRQGVLPGPIANFEGLSNQDNFNVLGTRVNPPDPNGAVGPNHYVQMINLVFGVFDR